MKIKIITCHFVHNYGAVLQAYALSTKLADMFSNSKVEIIDYRPNYLAIHHKVLHIGNEKYRKNLILKILYIIRTFPYRYITYKHFNDFVLNNLKITRKRYTSFSELKNDPPVADIYICGSDQIWNYRVDNGKDPAFYLEFISKGYKMAYAPSFAVSEISEEEISIIKPWISNLNQISIREKEGKSILYRLGFNNVPVVLDPVFLLEKKEWTKITSQLNLKQKYIFIYKITRNKKLYELAHDIASIIKAQIIEVGFSAKCDGQVDKYLCGVKIGDFLSYILNAEIVITDSFHGMSFSILFEKNFVVFDRGEVNSRISSMLDLTKLQERFYTSSKSPEYYLQNRIDYSNVKRIISDERKKSIDYLYKMPH